MARRFNCLRVLIPAIYAPLPVVMFIMNRCSDSLQLRRTTDAHFHLSHSHRKGCTAQSQRFRSLFDFGLAIAFRRSV